MKETKFSKLYLSNLWEMHDELPELQQQIKRLIENKMEKENNLVRFEYSNDLKERIGKKQELLNELKPLKKFKNSELKYITATGLLLAYIGDKDITEAYNKINKY